MTDVAIVSAALAELHAEPKDPRAIERERKGARRAKRKAPFELPHGPKEAKLPRFLVGVKGMPATVFVDGNGSEFLKRPREVHYFDQAGQLGGGQWMSQAEVESFGIEKPQETRLGTVPGQDPADRRLRFRQAVRPRLDLGVELRDLLLVRAADETSALRKLFSIFGIRSTLPENVIVRRADPEAS